MALTIPQDEKTKGFIVGAVVLVMAVAGYWQFFWKPAQVFIDITEKHATTLDSLNTKLKAELAKTSEAKLRAEADKATSELAFLRRLVPTQNEVPALTNQISTAARQAGMDISELLPDGELAGDYFDAIKYRLSVTGPYHKVGEFLTNIASLSRIMTPMNVEIIPSGRALERRPGKNERFVDARLQVQTYVARTMPLPAPAPPPGAAAKPGGK